ncbi:alpha/beta hydrolase [Chamaesiphon minutus]|uniref:Putative hydrolase or acyltransferase of alpha/beta superfamily n=1 Tax=Chamaesiphon minutus (strain ATCC 27169 / PCC 6605) TaxID=1173020 RepID=K9UFE8_CHAP6|nr:alpha/beta hydrolase [Chamaesiphon minutus]AFY93368.1 putative hydrolase or acyltransferase of alpha/beta superfamily [Chamaesiphon minutus PCC 6605]
MSKFIWVSASPSLKYFHRRLLNNLSKVVKIEFWEYYQTLDEGSSIDKAVNLLHEYLANSPDPVHLLGHGIGGVVALNYARLYPDRVTSLVLLSVAVKPGINWHSYYYAQLQSLPSNRHCVLKLVSSNLFPDACARHVSDLVDRLDRDLVEAPSNHSLFKLDILDESGVEMPLLVCGSQDDPAIASPALYGWTTYFKSTDEIWRSSTGGHFFHHIHFELLSYRIQCFWQKVEPTMALDRFVQMELN